MKKSILLPLLLVVFFACKSHQDNDNDTDDSSNPKSEKKISSRDYSITKANAYSTLFLDSADLENYIATNKISDSVSRRMRSFYNARNYQCAWFSGDGLTEQGRSFWNLHEYYTTYSSDTSLTDKALKKKMNALAAADDLNIAESDNTIRQSELKLTGHFITYMLKNYPGGEIKRKELERFVPLKKVDALYQADSLLTKKHKDNKYYADINPAYKALQDHLQRYYDIAKNGGWQPIAMTGTKLSQGSKAPAVLAIKHRLELTGEMPGGDTTLLFDNTLANAVKTYQASRGLTATGVVTPALVKDMNVPALKRLEQILINMGRMRWMLNHTEGNLIMVNIPEFVLHVYEGKKKVFDMNVVVGKDGHNTTMFTGNLNQVVFSPYWNVPQSIVQKEILPSMERDPEYLSKNNMETVGEPEDGIPTVRQLPGPTNSLGKVKFLFPNSFDIYFHDTPAKDLFNRDKRAYSHGCIRLSEPVKMANYVLRDQPEWTPEKIDEAMNSGEEQYVKVKNPIPVLITYYTAWVDENGVLNFRDDIYNHDATLISKTFSNPI